MRFVLEMDCDNDAFTDTPGDEMARILRVVARRVEGGEFDGKLVDANGNKVGTFKAE